jgi:hypothetical protein
MTVYVDAAKVPYRNMLMSHMVADSEDELHAMAHHIGIRRDWYQKDHYDVSEGKRKLAIQNGAIVLTRKELGRYLIDRRMKESQT